MTILYGRIELAPIVISSISETMSCLMEEAASIREEITRYAEFNGYTKPTYRRPIYLGRLHNPDTGAVYGPYAWLVTYNAHEAT